uniref:histone acetyltransferase n=1 Tax=Minutocellus polymorphus TaxID=265543 RepID=A0A7S0AQW1_9STRA
MFDKSSIQATKSAKSKGRNKKKRRKGAPSKGKSNLDVEIDSTTRKRRESWLGDDVGVTIRKMRRDFFVCNLGPGKETSGTSLFSNYAAGFDFSSYTHGVAEHNPGDVTPGLADARHALLEFLQQRNLEFNTLRKAKHSTAVILYYLHNKNAPGLIPVCSTCKEDICHLRWHRIKKSSSAQRRRSFSGGFVRPVGPVGSAGVAATALSPAVPASASDESGKEIADLCQSCYAESKSKNDYIPVRITFERST